jgi:hypothetical protein
MIEPAATLTETLARLDPPPVLQRAVIEPGPRIHPSLAKSGKGSGRGLRRWGLVIAAVIILVVIILVAVRAFAGASTPTAKSSSRTGASQTGASQTTALPSQSGNAANLSAGSAANANANANANASGNPALGRSSAAGTLRVAKPVTQSARSGPLGVRLAEAFGPDGTSDGDNPAAAMDPVTKGSTQPWTTDRYSTAAFGNLKDGTGLLLDMGRPVTVTSVIVNLGTGTDASIEVWAGNVPELSGLHVKASGANIGGDIVMRVRTLARARYVLVWFTALPAAANGQYQADVHDITIEGHP